MNRKKALIMVDLQNDFCEGGSLGVPEGKDVIPVANHLQDYFDLVIATQDWHPANHASFAANQSGFKIGDIIDVKGQTQILWPVHCVQDSQGAAFHPELKIEKVKMIFHKGIQSDIDSYSAFFDNAHLRSTGLGEYLKEQGVQDVYILGLATDYCVKFSVLDALNQGFDVYVIEDGCRGVDLHPGDSEKALAEMERAGARLIDSRLVTSGTL